jgi:hypothetical protein
MTEHKYTKYRPPECQYPVFQAFDYCWGLACAVDYFMGDDFVRYTCPDCEYYKEVLCPPTTLSASRS